MSIEREAPVSVLASGVMEKSVGSLDVDEAFRFLHSEEIEEVIPLDEGALIRKIDWMVMPLLFSIYFLQYMDKTISETRPIRWV